MASRSRNTFERSPTYGEFTIHLSHLEMLKLERLCKNIEAVGNEYFSDEELKWASNARQLFAPELPSGGYEI